MSLTRTLLPQCLSLLFDIQPEANPNVSHRIMMEAAELLGAIKEADLLFSLVQAFVLLQLCL